MEAVVAIELASSGIAVCSKIVTELKRFSHSFARAENSLSRLIEQVERVKRSSTLLSLIMREASKAGYAEFQHFALDTYKYRLDGLANVILRRASHIAGGSAARLGTFRKIKWTLNQKDMEMLMAELREVDEEARRIVELVTQYAQICRIASEVEAEKERTQREIPLVRDAFAGMELSDGEKSQMPRESPQPIPPTWLGHILTEHHDEEYVEQRERLADASKFGDWLEVFRLIELGVQQYGESWVNATRLKPRSESDLMSLWAPLHQAVYMGASTEVVGKLIGLGASRTLRTRWTEFTWTNMTALELAQQLQVTHLIRMLQPVTQSYLPPTTLQSLEQSFHALIQYELGAYFRRDEMLLPILEVLTEYAQTATWFPVKVLGRKAGYLYQLDARDLLVLSFDVRGWNMRTKYRITETEILEVDEASVCA